MALLRVYSEPHLIKHYSTVCSRAMLFQIIIYTIIIVAPFFICHATNGGIPFNTHHMLVECGIAPYCHRILAVFEYVHRAARCQLSEPVDRPGQQFIKPRHWVMEHVCWTEPSPSARGDRHSRCQGACTRSFTVRIDFKSISTYLKETTYLEPKFMLVQGNLIKILLFY